jgi:hypothetical protein
MARKVNLDFTGVESYKRCEEGIHTVKLVKIDEGTTQAGDDMLKATFEVTKGESAGARVFENFTLTSKALWKLKLFLAAIGMKTDGKVAIDLDKLINKTCDIEVAHEEYGGQIRPRILNYTKASTATENIEEEDTEEEEKPKKPAKKAAKKEEPKKEEDDDWEDDEDWEEE